MVSTVTNGNSTPAALEGLPPGNYTLVGWDLDATGKRLIDEICQIGAFTFDSQFAQYIMPHRILNFDAQRRHNIRVVTIGRFRLLKDNGSNKVLKTKAEISALVDFLDWLEKEKERDGSKDGIILILHEPRNVTPSMLLEALARYNLTDRFKAVVAGFADGHALAADKCKQSVKSFNIHVMAKVLLGSQNSLKSAADRAAAVYKIAHHLSQGEQQEVIEESENPTAKSLKNMVDVVRVFARSTETQLSELAELKKIIEIQNTFRPVFGPLFKGKTKENRIKIFKLRRLLADANINYDSVKTAWDEDKLSGVEKQLASLSVNSEEEQIKELVDIFDCHFDESKEPKITKPRFTRHKNARNGYNKNAKPNNPLTEESESATPDSASSGSPVKVKQDTENHENNLDVPTN